MPISGFWVDVLKPLIIKQYNYQMMVLSAFHGLPDGVI
jgi:hypothetical protein